MGKDTNRYRSTQGIYTLRLTLFRKFRSFLNGTAQVYHKNGHVVH